MKQKQVKATANGAKNAKTNKKEVPPKKVQEVVEENDEEEEEEVVTKKAAAAKKPAKKPANKKGAKAQKVEEEPEPEEEVEEEEQENDEDEVMEDEDDEQQEEDAEEDDEDEEAGDDEEEDPTIPSQVKSGEIPSTVLNSKVIHISKLPKKCDSLDITEAFAKYGAIDQIHLVTTPGGCVANLVFKTEKGAKAALEDKNSITVLGNRVKVSLKKERKKQVTADIDYERSVYIRNITKDTTEEDIEEHFKSCGEIEMVKLMSHRTVHAAYVVFKELSSVYAALKLHNTILNDVNVLVARNIAESNRKWTERYDEKRTLKLANKQQLQNIESKKLESILKKYGAIEQLDILCSSNVLAMVTYETEEDAEKALELNGKKIKDIEFVVDHYRPVYKTTIFVSNLPRDCTREDLEELFSKAGEIALIFIKAPGFATIRFKDSDGYCKSFLYHESKIKGNYIYIQPFSYHKQSNKNQYHQKISFKRGAGPNNGYDKVFKPKRAKNHI